MRVLIAASGSYGDIYPFVGLGRELRRRGHEVVFFASEFFRAAVAAERLDFVAIGSAEDYDRAVRDPLLWDPRRGVKVVMETTMRFTPPAYEALRAHHRPGETVVVASSLAFAARLLQESHRVPTATVHLSPSVFRSVRDAVHLPVASIPGSAPAAAKRGFWWMVDRFAVDPFIVPPLNSYRAGLGLPPVRRVFDRWLHSPDRVIGLFPEWFAARRTDWPPQTRLTGFPLYDAADHAPWPSTAETFLDAGHAPVLFAPGTANPQARSFFRVALAACERAGLRALLVTRYEEQIPAPLPSWAAHFPYLPFSRVLPRVHAFVHHGGIGTLSQGMRAGVPQLICPAAFDQFDNAQRASRLGVAQVLGAQEYRVPQLATALAGIETTCGAAARGTAAARLADGSALSDTADLVEALLVR